MRTTHEVLESHLALAQAGELERDLADNYAEDVVFLSAEGVNRGHEGARFLAQVLDDYVPVGSYSYDQVLVEGEVAMLEWSAEGEERVVHDGVDSYVVRDGLIRAQTIHFSTRER